MEFVNSNLDRLPLTFQRYLLKTQSSILAVHSTDEQIKIAQNTLEDIRTKKAKRLNVDTSKTIKCEEPMVATNVDNKLRKSNSEPQSMMNGRRRHLGTPSSSSVKIQNINNSSNRNGSNSGKNFTKIPYEAHEKRQPMITPIQRTKKPIFKASDNIVLVKKPTMSHLPVSVLNI